MGCENWDRYDFEALLRLVRSFVISIWDARKDNLYGEHSDAISDCSSSCSLTGVLPAPPAFVGAWSMA